MAGTQADACFACRNNALEELPPREQIFDDGLWRVAHAFNASRLGWLVAVLRRHAESLGDLTAAEAVALGRLLPALSRALERELGVPKAYVAFLAEQPGFAHVHIHVVARPTAEARGSAVFNLLQGPESEWVPDADMDTFARRLRQYLDS